jgi:cytochrome P450
MAQPITAAPQLRMSDDVMFGGDMPGALARAATTQGPVLRWYSHWNGRDIVFLVGPEANKFVLNTQRLAFSHDQGWTPIIGDILGRGLLNMDPPTHTQHRKLWNPAFTSAYMTTYLPLMRQVIAAHVADWAARDTIDLYSAARALTFAVAATALAGITPGPEQDRLQTLFATLMARGPSDNEDDTGFYARMWAAKDAMTAMLLRLIAERRANPPAGRPADVLSLIVHAQTEDGLTLTDDEVLGHLNILLVAGHETTTLLSTFAILLLARMPAQRARMLAELESAWPDPATPLTVETLRQLKYLDYFVRETGRLHPPVYNVPRGVVEDVEFGGYTIPAGTRMYLALAACHRLPEIFADPDRFDPDRFAPPREEDRRAPYSLVTFGGGSRLCIGVHFATLEIQALLAHLLRHYTWDDLSAELPQQFGISATAIMGAVPVRVRASAEG